MRGPLSNSNYRPQFSGHETFPLRYGWLKKAFDAVAETEGAQDNRKVFKCESAIADFGVGKNMVSAIRHWGSTTGIISESKGSSKINTTVLGRMLFGVDGLDPYMEHPATLWLIHWQLSARPAKTTWFWAFNYFPILTFDRERLLDGLCRLAKERAWERVSASTLRNDIACFIRTYVAQEQTKGSGSDSMLESPLTELGLIRTEGRRDGFRFVRGPKLTLGDGVFVYALLDFWSRYSESSVSLSFEAIAHEPGSPGRVFLLDENDVADRLECLEKASGGMLRWSETAGLKQVVRDPNSGFDNSRSYLEKDYIHVSESTSV